MDRPRVALVPGFTQTAASWARSAEVVRDQLRVTGKKRDDLQAVIALLKQADLGVALQFTNYR